MNYIAKLCRASRRQWPAASDSQKMHSCLWTIWISVMQFAQQPCRALVPVAYSVTTLCSVLIAIPSDSQSSDCLSVSTARVAVHHHILVPSVSVLLRSSRQMSWHSRHHSLCVLPLSGRPVGRVAGLLCERMTCLLAGNCGLLERCGDWGADIGLLVVDTCWRGVAGFCQTLFGRLEPGFELFELGCFGAEGLLPVGASVSFLFLLLLLLCGRSRMRTFRSEPEQCHRGCWSLGLIAQGLRLWTDQTCYPGLRQSSGRWSWTCISQQLRYVGQSTAYDSGRGRLPDMVADEYGLSICYVSALVGSAGWLYLGRSREGW